MIDLSLLPDFIAESVEHLEEMETNLLQLEADPGNLEILNDIFRSVHTIKGASEYMGMIKIAELSHKLESLMDMLRKGDKTLNKEIIDALIESRDLISILISELEQSQAEETDTASMLKRIELLLINPSTENETHLSDDAPLMKSEPETETTETETGDVDFETAIEKAFDDVIEIAPSTDAQPDPEDEPEDEDEPDTVLADEIRDDDIGDPELFDIFINQLNDSFYRIQAHLNNPPHSDDVDEILNQYIQIIGALRSSSNYMGYDKLTLFYEKWIAAIKQIQDKFTQTGNFSWSNFIRKYMKPYINKMVRLFPQLEKFWISTQWLEELDALKKEDDVETIIKADDTQSMANMLSTEEIEHIIEMMDSDEISDEIKLVAAVETEEPDGDNIRDEIAEPEKMITVVKADDTQSVTDALLTDGIERVIETAGSDKISDEIEPVAAVETEEPDGDNIRDEIAEPEKATIETVKDEDAVMPPPQEDLTLFDKLASAYEHDPQDTIHTTGDSNDMIDANLFSKNDLTPEERPVVENFLFSALAGENTIESEEVPPAETSDSETPFVLAIPESKTAIPEKTVITNVVPEIPLISETPESKTTIPEKTVISNVVPEVPLISETPESKTTIPEKTVISDVVPEVPLVSEIPESKTTILEKTVIPDVMPEIPLVSEIPEFKTTIPEKTVIPDKKPETPFVSEAQEDHAKPEDIVPAKEPQEPLTVAEPEEKDTTITKQQSKEKRYSTVIKKSVRVDAMKIDDLMNQVGELVVSRAWFSQLYNEMRELQQYLKESSRLEQKEMKRVRAITFRLSEATVNLGRVATELQEGVMRVRMLPISQLFNRYPRLVRDLIHDTPKKINLEIRGEDTELDKMIIEKISDPLIHIIRNAADHGIESADERRRAGKPETGRIILEAFHESNHVVIEVRDDGRGLNPEKIKAVAVARKFITEEELNVMSSKEVTLLILRPGFSTTEQVTHTSGRGVGMDVVKKNIEKLNGTLEIESEQGAFTQLRIKIPLTLAIIPALLVRVGKELYTIPLATVEETLRIEEEDTSTIEGNEVIYIRNVTLPLVRLSELFDIQVDEQLKGKEFVVIVSTGLKKIGLVVDDLIGQEEVVIKPLEDYLQEKSGFSGATILGDGRVSLILDVYELVNLTIERVTLMRSQKTIYGDFGDHNKVGLAASEARVAAL
ncbi:chemotaxis protein CheW [Desulfococcaceae bacterium HSG9]|nr:chemotaxis protein CheW [Desulfococcaceae bacterium HSG9]